MVLVVISTYSFRVLRIDVSVGSEKLLDHFEVALSRCEMQRTQLHTRTHRTLAQSPQSNPTEIEMAALSLVLSTYSQLAPVKSVSVSRGRERDQSLAHLSKAYIVARIDIGVVLKQNVRAISATLARCLVQRGRLSIASRNEMHHQ